MSRLNSRSSEIAGLVALSAILWSSASYAQACCAGGGAFAPARLKLFEEGLIGVQLRAVVGLGSLDGHGRYAGNPRGDAEIDLEQDVLGAYRFNEHAQIGLVVPFIETFRAETGLSGFGGSIGDLSVNARYDFIVPANEKHWPGIAVLGALTFPSGRPPDQAVTPLAVDATGTGLWQGSLGVELEQLIGRWALDVGASVWGALPRTVGKVTETLGPRITGLFAFGYGFRNGAAIAGTLAYNGATSAYENGRFIPDAPALMTAGVALGWPINFGWRLQAATSYDLPILGRNHVAGVGATFTVLRTF